MTMQHDVATLVERSLNVQTDLAEIKELLRIQNSRIKKTEDDLLVMNTYWKVIIGACALLGSGVSLVANFFSNWLLDRI